MYQKKGFTLIELLVVVLIIGVLSAVALPQYKRAVMKAQYVQIQQAADTIARAKTIYKLTNGVEAADVTDLDFLPSDCEPYNEGAQCTNKKYYCFISGYCCSKKYDGLCHYTRANGTRQCMARQDEADAQAVCKSMGGSVTESWNGFDYYLLP